MEEYWYGTDQDGDKEADLTWDYEKRTLDITVSERGVGGTSITLTEGDAREITGDAAHGSRGR